MAGMIASAPSIGLRTLQTRAAGLWAHAGAGVEGWFEAERDQLALWIPVGLGFGIALWFVLPGERAWQLALLAALGVALLSCAGPVGARWRRAIAVFALLTAAGTALIWWRAEAARAPRVERPTIARFEARVLRIERLTSRDLVRLTVKPEGCGLIILPGTGRGTIGVADGGGGPAASEPPGVAPPPPPAAGGRSSSPCRGGSDVAKLRINVPTVDMAENVTPGARIALRARLMPPPPPQVPGAYDFARRAWFDRIGGTGRALEPIRLLAPAPPGLASKAANLRNRLSAHIQASVPGSAGGVAASLATGDQGGIAEDDAEALRASGLAHLLSISGLHISAAVAAAMLLTMRLLALSPKLALHWPLPLIAGAAGAGAGLGYTLLAGADVPAVRACVAALLVLAGLALGREAITLRMVAFGALVVLLLWPESLVGASFQLSFAAVVAIVALHEHPRIRALLARREERITARGGRLLLSLLLSGLAVELVLAPIALYHFHRAGLFGALANIVAIPLTTFVIMPLEVLALLLDAVGLGGPGWWLTGRAISLLLALADAIAASPGAVATLPSMPTGAFALMLGGGLWMLLWRTPSRWLGLLPALCGAAWAAITPAPDILVTGDGRHVAIRPTEGPQRLLRPRAGDYVRDTLAETGGMQGEAGALDDLPGARCGRDLCEVTLLRNGRRWTLLATRSPYLVPIGAMRAACARTDIAISDRRLPRSCRPRWLKLDRALLAQTGGVAIDLAGPRVVTVSGGGHPWASIASRPPVTSF